MRTKKPIKKKRERECQHKWVPLLAKYKGKIISVSAKVCLKCGDLKIGTQTIKISRFRLDMGSLPIKSVGKLYMDASGRLRIPVGSNLYE